MSTKQFKINELANAFLQEAERDINLLARDTDLQIMWPIRLQGQAREMRKLTNALLVRRKQ